MNKNQITVVSGGWSREREISLKSGKFCAEILSNNGFKVKEVVLEQNIDKFISQIQDSELIFNTTHGTFGEDGALQALLDNLKIPYTHSASAPSNIAFNKYLCSSILKKYNLPSPRQILVSPDNLIENLQNINRDVVVKPTNEGSSFEVYILNSPSKIEDFCQNLPSSLLKYDNIMIEDFISGRELTISVLNGEPINITEIFFQGEFYDFKNKYCDNLSKHVCPAKLNKDIYDLSLDIATKVFNVVGCKGLARVDLRFKPELEKEGLFVLEINTQPGMTKISLAPEQAQTAQISMEQLLSKIIKSAS